MSDNENLIVSMRYPSAEEEMEQIFTEKQMLCEEEKVFVEESLERFWRRQKNLRYVPMPSRRKKTERFIRLAKKLSQEFQMDMDINKQPYFIEVSLHFYCAAYPKKLTEKFAKLLRLCDRFCSFVFSDEPWDFTLSLELDTHKCIEKI